MLKCSLEGRRPVLLKKTRVGDSPLPSFRGSYGLTSRARPAWRLLPSSGGHRGVRGSIPKQVPGAAQSAVGCSREDSPAGLGWQRETQPPQSREELESLCSQAPPTYRDGTLPLQYDHADRCRPPRAERANPAQSESSYRATCRSATGRRGRGTALL